MRPWEYHHDLTAERLVVVAQLIARGRSNALDRFDPDIGDDSWTRGVCAFNYGRHEIKSAAQKEGFEWLVIVDGRRHFQFRVGDVVMRFYRGLPDEPKENMLYLSEMEQLLLPLEEGVSLADVKFRIAVETDVDGSMLGAFFVAIRGKHPETIWPIPFESAAPLLVDLNKDLAEAVELDAAWVELNDELAALEHDLGVDGDDKKDAGSL